MSTPRNPSSTTRRRKKFPDITQVSQTGRPYSSKDICAATGLSSKFLVFLEHNADGMYHTLRIPKGNGKYRVVHNPQKALKFAQRRIAKQVLYPLVQELVDEDASGESPIGAYVRGKSCRDTAKMHVGKALIVSMDLCNFFDSTTEQMVYYTLRSKFTHPAAKTLAAILTRNGQVPQGAPTSGDICNIVAHYRVDNGLRRMLKEFSEKRTIWLKEDTLLSAIRSARGAKASDAVKNSKAYKRSVVGGSSLIMLKLPENLQLTYTRYSDDLDISSNIALSRTVTDALILRVKGCLGPYKSNPSKLKVERKGGRQVVLGMVVNAHPNVPRTKYMKYRALIHNVHTHGFDAQASRAGYKSGASLCAHLDGMVNYMGQVNPQKRDNLIGKLNQAKQKYAAELAI